MSGSLRWESKTPTNSWSCLKGLPSLSQRDERSSGCWCPRVFQLLQIGRSGSGVFCSAMKMSGPLLVKMSFHLPHIPRGLSFGHTNCHLLSCLQELTGRFGGRLGLHVRSWYDESLELVREGRRRRYSMLYVETSGMSQGGRCDGHNIYPHFDLPNQYFTYSICPPDVCAYKEQTSSSTRVCAWAHTRNEAIPFPPIIIPTKIRLG